MTSTPRRPPRTCSRCWPSADSPADSRPTWALLQDLIEPPLDQIGALPLNDFLPRTERKNLAAALNNSGWVHVARNEPAKAIPLLKESLAIYRASGDRWDEASSLTHLGRARVLRGEEAVELLEELPESGDALTWLHHALLTDPIVLDVPAGVAVADPIVVRHAGAADGPANAVRLLVLAEGGYQRGAETGRFFRVALGGWTYTTRFDDVLEVDAAGTPRRRSGTWGLYALVESELFREGERPTQGLSAFLRVGVADAAVNPIRWSVTAGLAYTTGIAAGRRLGSRLASFVALTEVLAAVVAAWLLLEELPGTTQLVGGLVVLAGVVTVKLGEGRAVHLAERPEPVISS